MLSESIWERPTPRLASSIPSRDPGGVETFLIPQWTDWGQIERRTTLPSFHFQLNRELSESLGAGLPWQEKAGDSVVGVLARDAGMRQPGRRIASAKSWLSHDGVDRSANLLPWQGDSDVAKMSPVDVSASFLTHVRDAWDDQFPDYPLDQQDVVITLPASFDEVARELTVAAAKRAGLPRVFLIEEPQAASRLDRQTQGRLAPAGQAGRSYPGLRYWRGNERLYIDPCQTGCARC